MYKFSIHLCFALLLLAELSLAIVSVVNNPDGSTKTIGCQDYYMNCASNLTRDRCCNGGLCQYKERVQTSICWQNHAFSCGQRFGQCDNGVHGAGCCSELDECNCNLNDTAICVCTEKLQCIRMNASCGSRPNDCCGRLTCQCNSTANECKCLTRPCLQQNYYCAHRPDGCCSNLSCVCNNQGKECRCGVPPPTPPAKKPECLRRDAKCDPKDDRCCCSDHCIYMYRYKRNECKKRPLGSWKVGCSED